MEELFEKNLSIMVVKRDGKKVAFDGAKIALAIKKAFDNVISEENPKYTAKDAYHVYHLVFKEIENKKIEKIKIEEIQDLIEESLQNAGYDDVYHAFSTYRENRKKSREAFWDEKKQHKFLKALEKLGLTSSHEEDSKKGNRKVKSLNAMETMLQYGSTVSREFAKSYLMKPKFATAHDSGDIYIHDMDFFPMGTTSSCQIDLNKLFKDGFSTGHTVIREPNDIMSYAALSAIAIHSNQHDQHGGQSIPAFDYYLAPGVLKTFKKQFKQTLYDLLDYTDFASFVAMNGIVREIDRLESISFDVSIFDKYCRESEQLERLFRISYKKALQKTENLTYQAMEAFIHNVNTLHSHTGTQAPTSSVNFGTDTSPEGRMVSQNLLKVMDAGIGIDETPILPFAIFKVKDGINYNPQDPNYDLLQLSCQVSSKRLFLTFSFLDSSFNKNSYQKGDYHTEVAYMGKSLTRILENEVDSNKPSTAGRGNLSLTTINLPRLGIKHGILSNSEPDLDGFFAELEDKMELAKDQLLERFEVQCNKKVYHFPFLLGQGLWFNSENLKPDDRLRKILKHGTLSIGFLGLAECLTALTGKHHGQSKEVQKLGLKIISFMRKKCDEYTEKYNLNYTLMATPTEDWFTEFTNMDKAIYGKIPGVTDCDYYTNSFHIPAASSLSTADKLNLEAPYHALTNGGHIACVDLPSHSKEDSKDFENILRMMKESGIGYGTIHYQKN